MEHLRNEIRDLEVERNNALHENKRLQNDIFHATQEALRSKRMLDSSKTELEEVKCQLQQYLNDLHLMEDHLGKKEGERMELLKHLKFISQETATLESSNQMLDTDLKRCRQQLTDAEKEIMRLEACIQDKECIVKSLEGKLQELSCLASQLEGQLQCAREEKYHQSEDLSRCQESLQQVVMQKEALRHQLAVSESCRSKIEEELQDRKGIIVTLQDQLNKERCHSANLEDVVRQSKSEMHDVCLSNQRYQEEIARLYEKVEYLTRKLQQEQDENEAFHRNIDDIRKEITTARYNNHKTPGGQQRDRLASNCRRFKLETGAPPLICREYAPRPQEHKLSPRQHSNQTAAGKKIPPVANVTVNPMIHHPQAEFSSRISGLINKKF